MSQRDKVRRAHEIARASLGNVTKADQPQAAKYVPATKTKPMPVRDESIVVLTLREASQRLGIGIEALEAMTKLGSCGQ